VRLRKGENMGNFLLGFGIGVTVGVLFAPKSGSETRDYLSKTAGDLTDKASQGTDYLMQQGQQLKDSASDLLERGKQAVMSQKERMGSPQNSPTQQYSS
jgi:gas vesicle protein